MVGQRQPDHQDDGERREALASAPVRTRNTAAPLAGYAAVYGSETVIDSWEGKFREVIAPGAFDRTLREQGDRVKVLYDHGMDPSVGSKPLGRPEVLRSDATGLWLECPLDDTSYNRDLAESLRSRVIDGMSFRFTVRGEKWTDAKDGRGQVPARGVTGRRPHVRSISSP
jgi:HK97 family phage prohead protease